MSTETQNANIYLYEFLYRGQAPDSALAPSYHVILAQELTDAFGNKTASMSNAMTPEQAKAEGFDLPAIGAAINTALLAENAGLKRALEERASGAPDTAPPPDATESTSP